MTRAPARFSELLDRRLPYPALRLVLRALRERHPRYPRRVRAPGLSQSFSLSPTQRAPPSQSGSGRVCAQEGVHAGEGEACAERGGGGGGKGGARVSPSPSLLCEEDVRPGFLQGQASQDPVQSPAPGADALVLGSITGREKEGVVARPRQERTAEEQAARNCDALNKDECVDVSDDFLLLGRGEPKLRGFPDRYTENVVQSPGLGEDAPSSQRLNIGGEEAAQVHYGQEDCAEESPTRLPPANRPEEPSEPEAADASALSVSPRKRPEPAVTAPPAPAKPPAPDGCAPPTPSPAHTPTTHSRKRVRLCTPRGARAPVASRVNRAVHGLVRRRPRGEAVPWRELRAALAGEPHALREFCAFLDVMFGPDDHVALRTPAAPGGVCAYYSDVFWHEAWHEFCKGARVAGQLEEVDVR